MGGGWLLLHHLGASGARVGLMPQGDPPEEQDSWGIYIPSLLSEGCSLGASVSSHTSLAISLRRVESWGPKEPPGRGRPWSAVGCGWNTHSVLGGRGGRKQSASATALASVQESLPNIPSSPATRGGWEVPHTGCICPVRWSFQDVPLISCLCQSRSQGWKKKWAPNRNAHSPRLPLEALPVNYRNICEIPFASIIFHRGLQWQLCNRFLQSGSNCFISP